MMHAVATSPDDLFLELPLGTLFEKRPERPSQRKEKNGFTVHRSCPRQDATPIPFVRIRPIRPFRPIRVQLVDPSS
jgi:hypothetical protein